MAADKVTLYNGLRFLGSPWAYQIIGLEHIRPDHPAVFIANHLANLGPIAVVISLPIRLHPWISAEMLDPLRAPGYLNQDFIGPTLHIHGVFGRTLANTLAKITVPMLAGLGCIPVERGAVLTASSFRRSLELIRQGESLLIFPEDDLQPGDPQTGTRPFLGGFVQLCLLYKKQTGKSLPVYALAVHPPSQTIVIDAACVFDQYIHRRDALEDASAKMRQRIIELYLSQERGERVLQEGKSQD